MLVPDGSAAGVESVTVEPCVLKRQTILPVVASMPSVTPSSLVWKSIGISTRPIRTCSSKMGVESATAPSETCHRFVQAMDVADRQRVFV